MYNYSTKHILSTNDLKKDVELLGIFGYTQSDSVTRVLSSIPEYTRKNSSG